MPANLQKSDKLINNSIVDLYSQLHYDHFLNIKLKIKQLN